MVQNMGIMTIPVALCSLDMLEPNPKWNISTLPMYMYPYWRMGFGGEAENMHIFGLGS